MPTTLGPDRLRLRLFGPLQILRGDVSLPTPSSRKTRAILGYLALTQRPVSRQRLCELFFEMPDDPRAALRWSLTKLRPLIDTPRRARLIAERDTLRLDLADAHVDALELYGLSKREPASVSEDDRADALGLVAGGLLEDAELPDRPEYMAWLSAQREDFRNLTLQLTRQQAETARGPDRIGALRRLLALDPLDEAAATALGRALVEAGRRDEAHQLVAQTERQLQRAGLKSGPKLRLALRHDREGSPSDPRPPSDASSSPPLDEGRPKATSTPVPYDDRPCIAVLPFQDLSAEALPGHIAAGFLDGMTHALSRFRSIVVISAASTAAYGGRLEDPVTTARSLGAGILVGGSLMAASDGRLRLRWRAVDGQAGRTLALGDTEGRLNELWDFQETAATAIAVEVEPRAQIEALRIRQALPTTSPDAYNLYLEGLFAGFSLEDRDYERSLAFFEQALDLDPRFHPALAMAPWAAAYGNRIQSPADLERFAQMSRDALLYGRDDARTQATAGTALFYMAHDFKAAHRSIERAIALNPNEYTAWICGGWMRAMKNEADQAHEMFDRAERLNPLAYGANGLMSGRAMAEFMAGRLETSEHFIEQALAGDDSHPSALMTGIATAAGLGKSEVCRARCAAFLGIYPDGLENFAIRALPFEEPSCRDRYFTAVATGMAATGRE